METEGPKVSRRKLLKVAAGVASGIAVAAIPEQKPLNMGDLRKTFGKQTGEAGFDSRYDANRDKKVNILDFSANRKELARPNKK